MIGLSRSTLIRRIFIVLTVLIVTLLLFLAGCGGGFQSDSGNADEFLDPIFNSDTT